MFGLFKKKEERPVLPWYLRHDSVLNAADAREESNSSHRHCVPVSVMEIAAAKGNHVTKLRVYTKSLSDDYSTAKSLPELAKKVVAVVQNLEPDLGVHIDEVAVNDANLVSCLQDMPGLRRKVVSPVGKIVDNTMVLLYQGKPGATHAISVTSSLQELDERITKGDKVVLTVRFK